MELIQPAWAILAICVVLAIVSRILRRKLINKGLMKEYQTEIKEKNKKAKEAMKEGEKEKAMKLNKEMLDVQMKMMQMNNKMLLVSMPIFFIALGALNFLYGGIVFESIIPLPEFANFGFFNPSSWVPIGITTTTGYFKAYFFYYMIATIVIVGLEKAYDKFLKK